MSIYSFWFLVSISWHSFSTLFINQVFVVVAGSDWPRTHDPCLSTGITCLSLPQKSLPVAKQYIKMRVFTRGLHRFLLCYLSL